VLRFLAAARYLSVLESVQTGFGAHPASRSLGTGSKVTGAGNDHSPHLASMLRMSRVKLLLPPCAFVTCPETASPYFVFTFLFIFIYRGADKSLARPTSLSIFFSVQRTGGSPTRPDPENRVGDQTLEP
jgi:hypothetical protein